MAPPFFLRSLQSCHGHQRLRWRAASCVAWRFVEPCAGAGLLHSYC